MENHRTGFKVKIMQEELRNFQDIFNSLEHDSKEEDFNPLATIEKYCAESKTELSLEQLIEVLRFSLIIFKNDNSMKIKEPTLRLVLHIYNKVKSEEDKRMFEEFVLAHVEILKPLFNLQAHDSLDALKQRIDEFYILWRHHLGEGF